MTVKLLVLVVSISIALLHPLGSTIENPEFSSRTYMHYIPIKWVLIVLGNFDYYKYPGFNAIQKVEHWIQSEGVP